MVELVQAMKKCGHFDGFVIAENKDKLREKITEYIGKGYITMGHPFFGYGKTFNGRFKKNEGINNTTARLPMPNEEQIS